MSVQPKDIFGTHFAEKLVDALLQLFDFTFRLPRDLRFQGLALLTQRANRLFQGVLLFSNQAEAFDRQGLLAALGVFFLAEGLHRVINPVRDVARSGGRWLLLMGGISVVVLHRDGLSGLIFGLIGWMVVFDCRLPSLCCLLLVVATNDSCCCWCSLG